MSKTKSKRQSGQFVIPGQPLGVIEEFTPGEGTYVEQGKIHANISGRTLLDIQNKTVSVYPLVHTAKVPKVGSIVTGRIRNLQSKTAVVRVFRIGNESLSGVFTGLLYISDVSGSFVDSIRDAFKSGDTIRARVISDKNRVYHLSTAEKNLGVIYAPCSQCGHTLVQKQHRMLCQKCGGIEKRHTAADYGEVAF